MFRQHLSCLLRMEKGDREPDKLGEWLAGYRYDLREMIRCRSMILPLVLTLLLSYGFTLTHPSVSVDDTAIDWYMDEGQILLQGRFFPYLLQRVLPVYRFQPVVTDLLAVLCMTIGVLLFSCVLDRAAEQSITIPWRTVFVCAAVSYPLIAEIFIYMQVSFTIGLCYLLSAVAAAALYGFWCTGRGRYFAAAAGIACLLAGSFESFIVVLIVECICLLIVAQLYGQQEDRPVKRFILRILSCGAAILIGLILKIIIMGGIRLIRRDLFLSGVNPSQNLTLWGSGNFTETFSEMMRLILVKYILHAFSYLPVGLYAMGFAGCLLAAILFAMHRKGTLALEFASLALSTQALSLIQGDAQRYRTCQCFAVFVGFLVMLIGNSICRQRVRRWVKTAAGILAGAFCLLQAQDLNRWFSLDYDRWQYEERLLTSAAQEVLRDYGDDRPVIFTGQLTLPDFLAESFSVPEDGLEVKIAEKVYRAQGREYFRPWLTETLQQSVITWAVSALDGANGQLQVLLAWEGYDFPACTGQQYMDAEARTESLPAYPENGSIVDCGDYVAVHMGG